MPGRSTPLENPYMPTQDIGAPQFIRTHPTYDGRGVTIAMVREEIGDLQEPELQDALTVGGQRVRKLAGMYWVGTPRDLLPVRWLAMSDTVHPVAGAFVYNGTRYRAPHDGPFRIGHYDRRSWWVFARERMPAWPL